MSSGSDGEVKVAEETVATSHLRHGSEWADHEDCIVGNEAGLKALRDACDVALREGNYFGNDLGEFVGVKRLESSWFQNPQDSKATRTANRLLAPALIVVFALLVIGSFTLMKWLF